MSTKKDIRNLSTEQIHMFCLENNLPKFRATQLQEWIWKKRVTSFYNITSLPKNMRKLLDDYFVINPVNIYSAKRSLDKSIKYSLQLFDKKLIEGVLIPSSTRITACISSQVGCSLDCDFCATGTMKLERNLDIAEIYDQVYILNEESISNFNRPISNIVYMGMGEPLLNYKNLLGSIDLITTNKGLGMSPKRITVSTAGIAKMIKKLGDDNVRFNLAISLHSASDTKRNILMSINKKIDLSLLRESIRYFFDKTGSRVTYEYILFKDVNDSIEDAKELVSFTKVSPCKINLIEYNKVDGKKYNKSSNKNTQNFISFLEQKNIVVNLRKSKGKDIAAACGQLVNKLQ